MVTKAVKYGASRLDFWFERALRWGIYYQGRYRETGLGVHCREVENAVSELKTLLLAYQCFELLTVDQHDNLDLDFEVLRRPEEH